MAVIEVLTLVTVAALATQVIMTKDPAAQAVVLGFYGVSLSVLFLVLHAPDVALSQIVVGAVYPLMVLLALAKVKKRDRE